MNETITREHYIKLLADGLTDFYGFKIDFSKVQDQLFLIEMGQKPTDEVIANWIKNTATLKK
jgi:hypothetical protein